MIDNITRALDAIWQQYPGDPSHQYAPMHYAEPEQNAIVFVGLNPSFSERGWQSVLNHLDSYQGPPPNDLFAWPRSDLFDARHAALLETTARQVHRFYKYHIEFAQTQNLHWEHFDLFAYRQTEQVKIENVVFEPRTNETLNDFGTAQFRQFEQLLRLANPAVIIIVNALAARIYCRERNIGPIDLETGHRMDLINGVNVPVFCSGMLTNGATDKFSRERLFWHVARTLQQIHI